MMETIEFTPTSLREAFRWWCGVKNYSLRDVIRRNSIQIATSQIKGCSMQNGSFHLFFGEGEMIGCLSSDAGHIQERLSQMEGTRHNHSGDLLNSLNYKLWLISTVAIGPLTLLLGSCVPVLYSLSGLALPVIAIIGSFVHAAVFFPRTKYTCHRKAAIGGYFLSIFIAFADFG